MWRKTIVWAVVKAFVDLTESTLAQKLTSLHIFEFFVEWTFDRVNLLARLWLFVDLWLFNLLIFRECAGIFKLTGGKVYAYSFYAVWMTIVKFISVLFEALWILACTSMHTLKSMFVNFTWRGFANFFTRYKFNSLKWLILNFLR